MSRRLPLLTLVTIVLSACDSPSGPDPDDSPLVPSAEIVDAAHDGRDGFYFLPPTVPDPSANGTFDGSLDPVVEICEWTGTECVLPLLAEFTTAAGPGSETVRVVAEDEHYLVNWHTDLFNLDVEKTYRIQVFVDAQELGYADVDAVSSGRELKNVDTGEYIALKDGRTLPIKFRVEDGAIHPAILFRSERDGNPEIYAINEDGSGLVRLTSTPETEQLPEWSPNRASIVFTCNSTGGPTQDICLKFLGGSKTTLTDGTAANTFPSWHPDGRQIMFSSNIDGDFELYLVDAGGAPGPVPCTDNPAGDGANQISIAGGVEKIVFSSSRDASPQFQIYLLDGCSGGLEGAVTPLTLGTLFDARFPRWSPDGQRIAFIGRTGPSVSTESVYIINRDGTGLTIAPRPPGATDLAGGGGGVDWSPHGNRLVVSALVSGNWDLYVVDLVTGLTTRVTTHPTDDLQPAWSAR